MRFRSSKWIVYISLKLLKTFTLSIDCKGNERPVSVLNTTTVYCLDHTACSGTYGAAIIGSCPPPAECAIIPQSLNVMGCVLPQVPGITYIRPDGTIYTTDGSLPSIKPLPTTTGNEKNRNGVEKQSIPVTQSGSNERSEEDESAKVVVTTENTENTEKDSLLRKKAVMPESSSTSALNNSNTSNKKTGVTSLSVVVICALVVIGLSIAAVVAGVRLLRNKKNAAGAAEAEAEDQNFGFGCVTPKDEVVLL